MKYTFVCLNCTHEFEEMLTSSKHPKSLNCPECGSKYIEREITDWNEVLADRVEGVTCGSRHLCEECGLCKFGKQFSESRKQLAENGIPKSENLVQVVLTNQSNMSNLTNQTSQKPFKIPVEKGIPVPPVYEPFTAPKVEAKKVTKITVKKVEEKKKKY